MESKEELIDNLKERGDYLEGELYQLFELADKMGGIDSLAESESRDAKDLLTAFAAVRKALKAVRRIIDRNK